MKIIKYKNRKLYDKIKKKFVTISDLETQSNNENFEVYDSQKNKDITYQTLVKILSNKLIRSGDRNKDMVKDFIETVNVEQKYNKGE